jgi:hypothetical protein
MQYLGDYRIDDYITFGAQLHRFSSGAVYAPTGNVTYTFYENNSTSGAPTGGNLAQLNSKTGLYTARVQLTTASGFEAGKEYLIHIEATVDSVAAAELLMFRITGNPKVDLDTIKTQSVTCGAGVTILASVGTAATSTAQTGDSYAIVNGDHGLVSVQDDIDTLLTRIVGTLASGTHTAQSGDAYAYLGTNLGAAGANATEAGGTGDHLTALATAAALATVDGIVDSILEDTGTTLPGTLATIASYIDTEVGTLVTNVGTILAAVDTEVASILEDTGTTLPAAIAALNNVSTAQVQTACTASLNAYDPPTKAETDAAVLALLTQQMTEAYNADGTAPTLAQALFVIMQRLTEFAIAGTTITVKKLDGSTTAMTLTLNDGTAPTSVTRAT